MFELTPKHAVLYDEQMLFSESFSVALQRLEWFDRVSVISSAGEIAVLPEADRNEEVYFFISASIRETDVFQLMREVRQQFPCCRIVLCVNAPSYGLILHAKQMGASAIVSKRDSFNDLKSCLQEIQDGLLVCSPSVEVVKDDAEVTGVCSFTARESEVLFHLFEGKNTEQIAGLMNLSRHTITTHKRNMMTKSGTRSIGELMAFSRRHFELG